MSGFKTYVITKKTLIKFGIIFSLIIFTIICLVRLIPEPKDSDAVAAFSYDAENILNEGVVSDKDSLTAKKVVNNILGFDTDDPVSIIESSGTEYEISSPAPIQETKKPEQKSRQTTQSKQKKSIFKKATFFFSALPALVRPILHRRLRAAFRFPLRLQMPPR